MAKADATIRSDIAWSNRDTIEVRGENLIPLIGTMDLGGFGYFHLTGRMPTPEQARMFNAMLVTLVEHGMTPSVIAARMTYTGAPEALQAAVAAGLCGLGSVFVGSLEGAARMLQEALAEADPAADLSDVAQAVVRDFRTRGVPIPGVGHPIHKPIDPRTVRLFDLAAENGLQGRAIPLMQEIARQAETQYQKPFPINATGAIGAIATELSLPWKIVRGLGVMARAVGLVGHILEESQHPTGMTIWRRLDDEASAHLKPSADTAGQG